MKSTRTLLTSGKLETFMNMPECVGTQLPTQRPEVNTKHTKPRSKWNAKRWNRTQLRFATLYILNPHEPNDLKALR